MTAVDEQMTLADWAATLPDDDQVYVDASRGHIRVGDVVFADVGSCLHLWSYQGHKFTPQAAGDLGRALLGWAERGGTS